MQNQVPRGWMTAEEVNRLTELFKMCQECESSCFFNRGGVCRLPMVCERPPRITEDDGCLDYAFDGEG